MSLSLPTADAVIGGDRRAAGRLITAAEAGLPGAEALVRDLYRAGGKGRIIGITGPPGAGKSTMVDRLVEILRGQGQRVAVLAVDPSSPLTGGAVLGDRVRMSGHAADGGVLIRSMAARGALGGLAHATGDAITVIDAMGFDVIIVETVGVGQSEVDILAHADVVVLLQTAHGGDGIQAVKAGILEVADIIAVNKAETPGTDRMIRALTQMVAHRTPTLEGWETPVLATEATVGRGVDAIIDAIDAFYACHSDHPQEARRRQRAQASARILALAQAVLRRRIRALAQPDVDGLLDDVVARRTDPYQAAAMLFPPD